NCLGRNRIPPGRPQRAQIERLQVQASASRRSPPLPILVLAQLIRVNGPGLIPAGRAAEGGQFLQVGDLVLEPAGQLGRRLGQLGKQKGLQRDNKNGQMNIRCQGPLAEVELTRRAKTMSELVTERVYLRTGKAIVTSARVVLNDVTFFLANVTSVRMGKVGNNF